MKTDAEINAEVAEVRRLFVPALQQAEEHSVTCAALITVLCETLAMVAVANGSSLETLLDIVRNNYEAAEALARAGAPKLVQ
jgi:pseudouridine-5'-phosphate glycosidase